MATATPEVGRWLGRLQGGNRDAEAAAAYCGWLLDRNREGLGGLGPGWEVLKRWDDARAVPEAVLLVRATMKQREHRFREALADLEELLRANPRQVQAWLTRAMLHQTLGEWDEARLAAAHLMPLSEPFVSATMLCSIESHTGVLEPSYVRLVKMMEAGGVPDEERVWAYGILADMALRLGRRREAEEWFSAGLGLRPEDGVLLAGLADARLARGDSEGAITLLADRSGRPHLGLRLAIAGGADAAGLARLREWFEAGAGGHRHDREEAMFRLRVTGEGELGLRLALQNWQLQREPLDAGLVLEGAIAAGDPGAARPVLDWLDRTGLEDVRLVGLRKRLKTGRGEARMPEFRLLAREAVRLEYPAGWEAVAEALHPWIVRQILQPANASAIDRLLDRRDEATAVVRRRLGIAADDGDGTIDVVLREGLRAMRRAAAFPDVRYVQLWDQGELKNYLSAGGKLRGLEFDRTRNEFTHRIEVRAGEPMPASRPVALPVFLARTDAGGRVEESKETLRRMMATRRHDHVLRAGQCVHEAVEASLARVAGWREKGKRWMREGIANVVAADVLGEVLGERERLEFLDAYDVRRHERWRDRVKLEEWEDEDEAGPDGLEAARYAFAAATVLAWDEEKLRSVIGDGRRE